MEYKSIKLEVKDGIAHVTVDRPKAMNAINESVMSELGHVFGSEGLDTSEVKGVILTGAGDKAFVAGADITQFNSFGVEEGFKLSKFGHDVYNSIERYPIPVIAAINGYSLGGGNELAMSCHMRICSDNAKFGQPEVNLGLLPGYGGTQRLIQYIGKGRATELLLTGDMIDAAKALEYGLVTHVCPLEDLISTAEKLINKISSKGPAAVSMTIRAVNAFFDKSTNGFAKEMDFFGKAMGSDECTEGVTAFLEKRKPNFRK